MYICTECQGIGCKTEKVKGCRRIYFSSYAEFNWVKNFAILVYSRLFVEYSHGKFTENGK